MNCRGRCRYACMRGRQLRTWACRCDVPGVVADASVFLDPLIRYCLCIPRCCTPLPAGLGFDRYGYTCTACTACTGRQRPVWCSRRSAQRRHTPPNRPTHHPLPRHFEVAVPQQSPGTGCTRAVVDAEQSPGTGCTRAALMQSARSPARGSYSHAARGSGSYSHAVQPSYMRASFSTLVACRTSTSTCPATLRAAPPGASPAGPPACTACCTSRPSSF